MKRILIRLSLFLLLMTQVTNLYADWAGCRWFEGKCVDYTIGDIFADVEKNYGILLDNRPVMLRYKEQRAYWNQFGDKSFMLSEGIADVLEKVEPVRDKFIKFMGASYASGEPRCAPGSPCHSFRNDLKKFFGEITELKDDIPLIQNAGLNNKQLVYTTVDNMPYLMLFSLYRGMDLVPDWQSLPASMIDMISELDDPEIFELDILGPSGIGQSTKTQRFCALRADKFDGVGRGPNGNRDGWDQIRINRWKLFFEFYADIWAFEIGLIPDDIDIGASILGEGGTLGIPRVLFTFVIEHVPVIIKTIMKVLDVHHANIEICKSRFSEIEGRLAACKYFSEFVLDPAAQEEYYRLVERRFEMADEAGISYSQSRLFMTKSKRRLSAGDYLQAYSNLCESYSSIGVSK